MHKYSGTVKLVCVWEYVYTVCACEFFTEGVIVSLLRLITHLIMRLRTTQRCEDYSNAHDFLLLYRVSSLVWGKVIGVTSTSESYTVLSNIGSLIDERAHFMEEEIKRYSVFLDNDNYSRHRGSVTSDLDSHGAHYTLPVWMVSNQTN